MPRTSHIAYVACAAAVLAVPGLASAQSAFPTVFLVHNVSDSVVAYEIGADGRPTEVGFASVPDGPLDIALSPDGSRLAVSHATQNSTELVTVLSVEADGSLAVLASFQIPDAPLALEWLSGNALAISSSIFGASTFRVYRYEENPNPSLSLLQTVSPGGFLTAMELNSERTVLYANDSSANAVRAYEIAADGTVSLFGTEFTGLFPIDITLTPDGERMYAGCGISGGGNSILGFDVLADGSLEVDANPYNSPGESPAYICAPEGNAYLFVGHGTDATVRSFAIDDEDGSLTYTGYTFDVGLQGTIGDIVELNGFLFVTDESTAIDGVKGMYSFTINADGSLTQNGPILDTGGTRPETMAVWSGGDGCPADFNGDGDVNTQDVLAFLNAWTAGDDRADFNGDGEVNTLDVLAFLNAWSDGC